MSLPSSLFDLMSHIPWAKVLYSAILVGLVGFLSTEIVRLWSDPKLEVGEFEYIDNGEEKPALGKAFASQVRQAHEELCALLSVDQRADDPWTAGVEPLSVPRSTLADVELTYQGINLQKLFGLIRQSFASPNEIRGNVQKTSAGFRVAARWPNAPDHSDAQGRSARAFSLTGADDVEAASFQVACGIIWGQAAAQGKTRISKVPLQDFCVWGQGFSRYSMLRQRVNTGHELSENEVKLLRQIRRALDRLASSSSVFPDVYRLRADVIVLMPSAARSVDDDLLAQNDRARYLLLTTSGDSGPPPLGAPEERSESAVKLAGQARPMIPLPEAVLAMDVPANWQPLLDPAKKSIGEAAKSVFRLHDTNSRSTAFLVAPGIILTTSFSIPTEKVGALAEGALWVEGHAGAKFSATEVLAYDEEHVAALVRIDAPHTLSGLPLRAEPLDDATALGRHVYLLGYGVNAQLRLSPGRVVRYHSFTRKQERAAGDGPQEIAYDASSEPGSAGSPLIDLETGKVIGLHYGKKAEDGIAQLAAATPISDILALAAFRDALRKGTPKH